MVPSPPHPAATLSIHSHSTETVACHRASPASLSTTATAPRLQSRNSHKCTPLPSSADSRHHPPLLVSLEEHWEQWTATVIAVLVTDKQTTLRPILQQRTDLTLPLQLPQNIPTAQRPSTATRPTPTMPTRSASPSTKFWRSAMSAEDGGRPKKRTATLVLHPATTLSCCRACVLLFYSGSDTFAKRASASALLLFFLRMIPVV